MTTEQSRRFIQEYFADFSKNPSQETINKYIEDPHLIEHIKFFQEGLPGYKIQMEDMIAEGNKVTVRGKVHGQHNGTLFGIPATGRTVNIDLIIIYELENNKIVNHWMQADSAALMQQIGAMPQAAG